MSEQEDVTHTAMPEDGHAASPRVRKQRESLEKKLEAVRLKERRLRNPAWHGWLEAKRGLSKMLAVAEAKGATTAAEALAQMLKSGEEIADSLEPR